MRHRKKLLLATILLAAAYAALCFWPHSNPEAVQALAALREMVEIDEDAKLPQPAPDNLPKGTQMQFSVAVAMINMTDATTGLFAEPGRNGEKAVVGRVKSDQGCWSIIESMRRKNVIIVLSEPICTTLLGQQATFATGASVPVISPPGSVGELPTVNYRDIGTTFRVAGHVTTGGAIVLDVECELSQRGRSKTVATAQGPMEIPEVHSSKAKASVELKVGETLVIGGLSQKRPDRTLFKVPVLSELPGVGSWFSFQREREIEAELVILVTPRIITPLAAK